MKKLKYILLLLLLIAMAACSEKEEIEIPGEPSDNITGNWELSRLTFSGMARSEGVVGRFEANALDPEGNEAIFKPDHKFEAQSEPMKIEVKIHVGPVPLKRTIEIDEPIFRDGTWERNGTQLLITSGERQNSFEIERLEVRTLKIRDDQPLVILGDDFPIDVQISEMQLTLKR